MPESKRTWLVAFVLLSIAVVPAPPAVGGGLPPGLLLTGLHDGQWSMYVTAHGRPEFMEVITASEPRTPAIAPDGGKLAYIDTDGALREIDRESNVVARMTSGQREQRLTHLAYDRAGRLIAVKLRDGNSADTDLVRIGADGTMRTLLAQRSAQFEPHVAPDGTIHYANVHCVNACGRTIQEIWRYESTTGQASQVTRLNAISRQPHLGPDGDLYFSSNVSGAYRIWHLPESERVPRRLTRGPGVDSRPVVTDDRSVYFLRHGPDGAALMRIAPDMDRAERVDPGVEFSNLKDLGLARCVTEC